MAVNYSNNEMVEDSLFDAKFSHRYLMDHIYLPKNKQDTPQIIGWSGPARCGSTGLLFLFASQPEVNYAYYQPQKTILRYGEPDLNLNLSGKLICMKEVFLSWCAENHHDPLENLLQKGMPPEKITWIIMLRDPVQNFGSWYRLFTNAEPYRYAKVQKHTIELFYRHVANGVNILPLTYDLFEGGREEEVINALLAKTSLPIKKIVNKFDKSQIYDKFSQGEWQDPAYFDAYVKNTLNRDKFTYSSSSQELPSAIKDEINILCRKEYDAFRSLAQSKLAL